MEETPSQKFLEDRLGRKPGSASGFPLGEEHRVFKVRGKIFAVLHNGAPSNGAADAVRKKARELVDGEG